MSRLTDYIEEQTKYYFQCGNAPVSATQVHADLVKLRELLERGQYQSPPLNSKICHRSMSLEHTKACIGSCCDRYNNCRVAWKRALLDLKTYDLVEEK